MKAADVCNRNVVTIRENETIIEAARRMRHEHVGDLVVLGEDPSSHVPVGMITDRDLVVGVIAQDPDHIRSLLVSDVMSREVVSAQQDEDLLDVVHRMAERGVRRIPIVGDDRKLVGLLTYDDLVELFGREIGALGEVTHKQLGRESRTRL